MWERPQKVHKLNERKNTGGAELRRENVLMRTLLKIEMAPERGEKGEQLNPGTAYLEYTCLP